MATDIPSDPPKPENSLDSIKPRYTTTTTATTAITTTTAKPPTSINPFYFGFSKFTTNTNKPQPQTQHINNRSQQSSIGSTMIPSISLSYSNNNNNRSNTQMNTNTVNSNFNNIPPTKLTSTTFRPTTSITTTSKYNLSKQKFGTPTPEELFFNSYLKKLKTTTRNPYNFDNLAEYYKTTPTSAPLVVYSWNFLGANSKNAPPGILYA